LLGVPHAHRGSRAGSHGERVHDSTDSSRIGPALGVTTMPHTFDIAEFKQAVERHWRYHAPSRTLHWKVTEAEDGWNLEAAPVFQEIVGGDQDGSKV